MCWERQSSHTAGYNAESDDPKNACSTVRAPRTSRESLHHWWRENTYSTHTNKHTNILFVEAFHPRTCIALIQEEIISTEPTYVLDGYVSE